MDCNTIEWLADLLGTLGLLAYVISDGKNQPAVVDVSERGTQKSAFRAGNVDDGLYFDGAHWYSVKSKTKTDSYTKGYQVKGTAHFCQTFAAMIFTGLDARYDLKSGEHSSNIKKAMQFWLDVFGAPGNAELLKWFLSEIKTSVYKDQKLYDSKLLLKNITKAELLAFLKKVMASSDTFVNCKQG